MGARSGTRCNWENAVMGRTRVATRRLDQLFMGTKFGTTVQKITFDLSVVIRVHCDRSEEGVVQRTSLNTGAWRIPMACNAL
jgi:hypothetical protein